MRQRGPTFESVATEYGSTVVPSPTSVETSTEPCPSVTPRPIRVLPPERDHRLDDGVRLDGDLGLDGDGRRIVHGDAGAHVVEVDALASARALAARSARSLTPAVSSNSALTPRPRRLAARPGPPESVR